MINIFLTPCNFISFGFEVHSVFTITLHHIIQVYSCCVIIVVANDLHEGLSSYWHSKYCSSFIGALLDFSIGSCVMLVNCGYTVQDYMSLVLANYEHLTGLSAGTTFDSHRLPLSTTKQTSELHKCYSNDMKSRHFFYILVSST